MGAGGSVAHNERQPSTVQRKSIRDQFNKEFGRRVSNPNIAVKNGLYDKEKLKKVGESGESSSELDQSTYENGESASENNGSISDNMETPTNISPNSTSTTESSVYYIPQTAEESLGTGTNKPKLNAAVFRAKALFLRPVLKKRPQKDTLVVKKQNNPGILKELYQRMDPSLNSELTSVIVGELEVAAKFKPEDAILLIKIGRGKDLPKEDGSPAPDPYVVVDIFPSMNPSDLTTRVTKVKYGTVNPYFQEILTFPMSQQNVSTTKLRTTVWDKMNSSQDVFLGESLHDIYKLDLNSGNIAWHKLYPKIQYATTNPVWMDSFEFDVHPSEFSRRTIVINLLNKNTSGRDQHLGDVHIPMTEYDFQRTDVTTEYILKDLRNTQHSKSAWSEEGLAMEFRESMRAHMIYGYPKFIFKKHHKGKMVVSCRSKRAQTQSKMVIDQGIITVDNVQM